MSWLLFRKETITCSTFCLSLDIFHNGLFSAIITCIPWEGFFYTAVFLLVSFLRADTLVFRYSVFGSHVFKFYGGFEPCLLSGVTLPTIWIRLSQTLGMLTFPFSPLSDNTTSVSFISEFYFRPKLVVTTV